MATTARVAKALEGDARTLHCSNNLHFLGEQAIEKWTVGRQTKTKMEMEIRFLTD